MGHSLGCIEVHQTAKYHLARHNHQFPCVFGIVDLHSPDEIIHLERVFPTHPCLYRHTHRNTYIYLYKYTRTNTNIYTYLYIYIICTILWWWWLIADAEAFMKKHCRGRVINADKKTRRRFLARSATVTAAVPFLARRPVPSPAIFPPLRAPPPKAQRPRAYTPPTPSNPNTYRTR